MKKLIFLTLIIFCFSEAYTQDLIKEIQKLTLVNDSLQKQVIKPLNDSILRLNSSLGIEITKLNKQIKKENELIKKINILESNIAELNKNTSKIAIDNLSAKNDTLNEKIAELNNIIIVKNSEIIKEKENGVKKAIQEKEKGKQEVLSQIIQNYSIPFDELIKISTLKTVDRDMSLVGNNKEVQKILLNLQRYLNSEKVLNDKFDEKKVKDAKAQLLSIEQTDSSVLKLTERLSDYKLCSDALKTTINEILEIDKTKTAVTDKSRNDKLLSILDRLASYIRNYSFNFSDYPYLNEIVLEIINRKQKDPNTDITDLNSKL